MSAVAHPKLDLNKLWQQRWNQEIETCLDALPELQKLATEEEQNVEQIEARLLLGSLHRSRGKIKEFENNLNSLETEFDSTLLRLSRHYAFERGLAAYIKDDFITALEHFVRFRMNPLSDAEMAATLMNEVFCLENLGFPNEKTLKRLDDVLEKHKTSRLTPFPAIRNQRRFFEYSLAFRNGSTAFVEENLKQEQAFDQSRYLAIWTALLPYHIHTNANEAKRITDVFVDQPYFFQRGYRARTLTETMHLNDGERVRMTDQTERLYLWSWRWLTNPNASSASLLLQAFKYFIKTFHRDQASPFDLWLVKNATSWMSLFCPAFEERFRPWLKELQPQNTQGSQLLLEYESLVIHYFAQLLKNSDGTHATLAILENHPFYQKSDITLGDLIKNLNQTSTVPRWHESLNDSLNFDLNKNTTPAKMICSVDLQHSIIRVAKGESVNSESLCRAIQLLKESKTVSVPNFMKTVFGIHRYDEFIHQPKLFNLISRLKDLLGKTLTFKVRNGTLHTDGDWNKVYIHTENTHARSLKECQQWLTLGEHLPFLPSREDTTTSIPNANKVEKLALSQFSKKFTRNEIHQVLGGSRASVIRRLNDLLENGKLLRQGKGKSTTYILKQGESL